MAQLLPKTFKFTKLVVVGFFTCVSLLLAGYVVLTHSQRGGQAARPLKIPVVIDGDLVFRQGVGAESSLARAFNTSSQFSHVGMAVVRNGTVYIVHAVPGSHEIDAPVKRELLQNFLRPDNAADYLVVTPKQPESIRHGAAAAAELMWQKGVRFDPSFSLGARNAVYCTELVELAYEKAGAVLVRIPSTLHTPFGAKQIITIEDLLRGAATGPSVRAP